MYPVFFDGNLVDVIDIERITPECPPLISKGLMKKCEVNLDFGEQKTHVKRHRVTAPFIKGSLFLDLLGLGPVDKFDRSKAPKEFWLDPPGVGAESVSARDAQNYEKY